MSFSVSDAPYGKSDISLLKVDRKGSEHTITELSVQVKLRGDVLIRSYQSDDNSMVVPTDTLKNTVYAVAYDHPMQSMEGYG
jgi:urate oxidase